MESSASANRSLARMVRHCASLWLCFLRRGIADELKANGNEEENIASLNAQILRGVELKSRLAIVESINGVTRLQRLIQQEINFLKKVLNKGCIKKEHAKCSNIHHYDAVVNAVLKNVDTCAGVLQSFPLNSQEFSIKRLCVDVVTEGGNKWIKVIARNPKALSQLSSGAGEFGQRSTIDHAQEYLACAKQHPHHFHTPQVTFEFACGIEETLANHLKCMGIEVLGDVMADVQGNTFAPLNAEEIDEEEPSYNTLINHKTSSNDLNLDVTALIAYISDLTNGGANYIFQEPILTQQAEWERLNPSKPLLDELFTGKELVCCETAAQSFQSIVDMLAGPGELVRCKNLMERVRIVPDNISDRTKQLLSQGGKIKERSMIIFGTGDFMKAPTVTANKGFVLSAHNQGIDYAVFLHGSRALTESKLATAISLPTP